MIDIEVDQAIFTSARTAAHAAYHLVARSPGVGHALAQRLTQWGPTQGALIADEPDAEALSFFSAGTDRFCIARTIYGGPEYSGRGQFQVFTSMLIVTAAQLAGYCYDPLAFIRAARVLGHLRFRSRWPSQLPPIGLPGHDLSFHVRQPAVVEQSVIARSTLLLARGERLALTGMKHPTATLSVLIDETTPRKRLDLSFTTGLKPSFNRRFQIHVMETYDNVISARLKAQGIRCVAPTLESQAVID